MGNHAFLGEPLEIDHARPEFLAEQQDRDGLYLAGLHQRQQLEKLVERAKAAGEHGQRTGTQQEMHLAQREIVELEGQFRRDIAVGRLLMRQHDIEADGFRANIHSTPVRRFHDRGTAA